MNEYGRVFFDDNNWAALRGYLDNRVELFDRSELSKLETKLKELPIENYHIKTEPNIPYLYVQVEFDNPADEAYFKILTADGIEI